MAPLLDIYVLTKQRNMPTLQRFIETYVDRAASEDRGNEELMIAPLVALKSICKPETSIEWESEPAQTLTHMIARGLEYPRRGFNIYLTSCVKTIQRAIITFTSDDLLVLRLSVNDREHHSTNEQQTQKLMRHLVKAFDGYLGMICVELHPPLLEHIFRQREGTPRTICFWKSEASPQ